MSEPHASRSRTRAAAPPRWVPLVAFLVLAALGTTAAYIVGPATHGGILVNLALIVFGAGWCAAGLWLLQRPAGVYIAPSQGHDAFGQSQFGPSRPATANEMRTQGIVNAAIGLVCVVLGAFVGYLV